MFNQGGGSEFPMQAISSADGRTKDWRDKTWRDKTCRIALLIVIGAMLAGCDKCGDWWSPMRGESQTCRDQVPRPR
jgi:hypothetical protein